MTPAPSRETPAGLAYNELRRLARSADRSPEEYFTLYALEGVLTRLAQSEQAQDFVLKGGVLMAAFAGRRPTRDIDLAAIGLTNDIPEVVKRLRTIVAMDIGDGLTFDHESVAGRPIRDDAAFAGVRVTVSARLATAVIALHVDVNFGDPIWPAPTDAVLPLLLGGNLRLRGYPAHMVLAEKIVTAIDRGEANTRWRDFVDIAAIADAIPIRQSDLLAAMGAVADYRRVRLEPLGPLRDVMPSLAQAKWSSWRRKQRLEQTTAARFSDLLDACLAFAEPVLQGRVDGLTWDHLTHSWTR